LEPAVEKKALSNEHSGGGTSPSSKSRSKRTPVATAYHHRSRLKDAVTPAPKWKRPNAQKHGVFSECPTIPGEDPREFQELHSALIDEWQPAGPSEEDAVFSLADLMWRKRRAQRFIQAKLKRDTFYAGSPAFDETRGLALFAHFVDLAPEVALESCGNLLLSPDRLSHLKQKFPRSNYQSTKDWAEAIQREIQSVLHPAAAPEPGKKVDDDLTEAVIKLMSEWLMVIPCSTPQKSWKMNLNYGSGSRR
jgi:hypothetical protein